MSELAVYEGSVVALPQRTGTPGSQDFDSWVAVASEVVKLANVIYDTPFVPDGLRSGPAVAAAILAGREMGLGPMTSLANIDVIKGKPSQKALLMRALIQSQGHKWQDGDVSDVRAVVRACRKGEAEWAEVTFTAAQAKTAGIDLGKYPADKLYARATARMARRKFADVIMGMPYSSEELADGDDYDEEAFLTHSAPQNGQPAPSAAAPAKPRTAQRKPRQAAAAQEPPGLAGPASVFQPDDIPGPPQPPLPGEDDPESEPDKKAAAWVGVIVQHFARLGITDRDERLIMTTRIAGRPEPVESTKDLDDTERKRVSDTLSRCKDRGQLVALLAKGDAPDGS